MSAAPGPDPGPCSGAGIEIAALAPSDWPVVRQIYAEAMATGNATFETVVPEWPAWDAAHRPECRLVARMSGEVVGFLVLSAYSSRAVYAGVAWESIYIGAEARGRGVGKVLLAAGCRAADVAGIWTLIAGILAENAASLALHARTGFRRVGTLERVGRDATGRWRDVVLLERRAAAAGPESPPE